MGSGCPCLLAPKSSYRQVQLHKCLGDVYLLPGVPGSKEENFLFSFLGFLLSDYDKTQHPVVKVTGHIKSWCSQTNSLSNAKGFFSLNHSPSDCESRVNNFQMDHELRVNNFLNGVL